MFPLKPLGNLKMYLLVIQWHERVTSRNGNPRCLGTGFAVCLPAQACVPRTGRRLRRLFRRALSLLSKRRDGVSLRGAEGDEAVSGAGVHGRTVVILHARTCVRGRII